MSALTLATGQAFTVAPSVAGLPPPDIGSLFPPAGGIPADCVRLRSGGVIRVAQDAVLLLLFSTHSNYAEETR